MFISDDFIFIELHKTGSSHIVKLLSSLVNGQHIGKHNAAKPEHFTGDYIFLGSIRNPWDWYLSLWSYGCGQQGAFYEAVTRSKPQLTGHGWKSDIRHAFHSLLNEPFRHASEWRECYTDVKDASKFNQWLSMVHDPSCWADFGEGYSESPIKSTAGFMSYRYFKLFCQGFNKLEQLEHLMWDTLHKFDQENCYIDHFIYNENLEQDLIEAVQKCGVEVTSIDKANIYSYEKTNTSSRKSNASYYYNSDTIKLVQNREALIINKFGYQPPQV